MNMQQEKQEYHSPRVKSVEFKVEDGFASINFDLGAVPFYSQVANDGTSFWGGNTSSGFSHGDYGSQVFSWGGSSEGSGNMGDYSEFGWNW